MTCRATSSDRRRWRVTGLILAVLALIAASCSNDTQAAELVVSADDPAAVESTPGPTPTPVETTAPLAIPEVVPPPTSIPIPQPTPEFGPTGRPSSAGEVQILTAKASVSRPTVFDGPDGSQIPVTYQFLDGRVDPTYDWFINPTFYGNDLVVMVVTGEPGDDWAEVLIPTRPIMTGWVETSDFTWSKSNHYVQVNIGNNTVTVWDGDEVIVDSIAVVTGDVRRETPIASTYVDEIMPGPSSAYGPWLLSLGVFSDAINTFGSAGGLPKVALHGTNRPDLLGQYASNGCIRLPNDIIADLAGRVPVGTRVDIISQA